MNSILSNLDDNILDATVDEKDERFIQKEISETSDIRIKIGHYVKKLEVFNVPTAPATDNHGSTRSVKLPSITLPTFDGNPMNWPAFWDLFRTSIHERTDISPAAKFNYLMSQLKSDAKNLLTGFNQTEQEYDEAIELLKLTFGKNRLIITARLHAIFDLKSPSPTSSELSKFRSSYEGHLRALRSLGCNIVESGYVFAAILLRKLPPQIADNINRANSSDSWKLEDLRKAIEMEINLLSATESTGYKDKFSDNLESSAAFHISANKPKFEPKKFLICNFCSDKSHYSTQCKNIVV